MTKPIARFLRRTSPGADTKGSTGSLTQRMIVVATLWIAVLLTAGGIGLDRILTSAMTRNFDAQGIYVLNALIASAEIGPEGEVLLNRPPADQRFLEPYSGLYYQISRAMPAPLQNSAFLDLPSRSLWDRRLRVQGEHNDFNIHIYNSSEFPDESLRIIERDVRLPSSALRWRFQVAQDRKDLDGQIGTLRKTLIQSFGALGLGLIALAALQAIYGLWPLRRVRKAIAAIRSGTKSRVEERLPQEIAPLTQELNDLLEHNETQAEEARRHAGNLAHALKTPLTIITQAASANSPNLDDIVMREAGAMRRQIDHQLARARAIGRRSSAQARADVWPSLQAVKRAINRLYEEVVIDLVGDRQATVRVERQDLDEMLGNVIENAAKYGGGRIVIDVAHASPWIRIEIEDNGKGIAKGQRDIIFGRGVRLDQGKPGTGLGLAIVRDVAEIYGGSVSLEKSRKLGGLLVRLQLPAAKTKGLKPESAKPQTEL